MQYKAQAEQSRKNLEKLETDNSGMFGLLGVLQDAGSAGGALGNLLASGLEAARKPTEPLPNVAKAFSKVWKAHEPKGQGLLSEARAVRHHLL